MASVKLIYNLYDKKTNLAEWVLDGLYHESRVFVDKIGPGRSGYEKIIRKYQVRTFPTIIVAGVAERKKIRIDGEKSFTDAQKLKAILADAFIKV